MVTDTVLPGGRVAVRKTPLVFDVVAPHPRARSKHADGEPLCCRTYDAVRAAVVVQDCTLAGSSTAGREDPGDVSATGTVNAAELAPLWVTTMSTVFVR